MRIEIDVKEDARWRAPLLIDAVAHKLARRLATSQALAFADRNGTQRKRNLFTLFLAAWQIDKHGQMLIGTTVDQNSNDDAATSSCTR
jgi:hypothetical protein